MKRRIAIGNLCCTFVRLCYNVAMPPFSQSFGPSFGQSFGQPFSRTFDLALRALLGLGVWLAFTGPQLAVAERPEPTPIREILEYPEAYHLHNVIIHGTARTVRAFDPYKLPAGSVCYGAYSFRLEDETGSLPVVVLGLCGVPIIKDPDVEEGDVLTVEATSHAPGKGTFFLTLDGRRMPFSETDEMQGVALNIWPEDKPAPPEEAEWAEVDTLASPSDLLPSSQASTQNP